MADEGPAFVSGWQPVGVSRPPEPAARRRHRGKQSETMQIGTGMCDVCTAGWQPLMAVLAGVSVGDSRCQAVGITNRGSSVTINSFTKKCNQVFSSTFHLFMQTVIACLKFSLFFSCFLSAKKK